VTRAERRIGFDRKIEISWLDTTANLVAEKLSIEEITNRLDSLLLSVGLKGAALTKTRTVLLGVWVKVPEKLTLYRDAGIKLFYNQEGEKRLAIHWGMSIASYPFFGYVVNQIGRLHRLQEGATLSEIRRRVVEKYGDTERVHRSVRHVTQTLRIWNIFQSEDKGYYKANKPIILNESHLQAWLIESIFYSNSSAKIHFNHIIENNIFFPFELHLNIHEISKNPRLEIFRQELDSDVVLLKPTTKNYK